MRKKIFPLSLLLLFSLGLTASALITWVKDVNVELTKSDKHVGEVEYSGVQRIKNELIPGKYAQPAFLFKFKKQENFFGVYRSYHGYDDLRLAIKKGDTILVYYRPSDKKHNLHVFQIEENGQVIIGYSEYNESISKSAGVQLFLGIIGLIASFMYLRDINLIRFLNKLVEP